MPSKNYIETFDKDAGGWIGWIGGGGGPKALELADSAATTRSPWGIDINHAPPGAGYLHLLYVLLTTAAKDYPAARFDPLAGPNKFINGDYPRDFTKARMTFRVKGDLRLAGSELALLIQCDEPIPGVRSNHTLHGQPIKVTKDWSEQTITLEPDEKQWTPMGVRKVGADCATYGNAPIAAALKKVNVDIILVLFPLEIVPVTPPKGGLHDLRAGKDYAVDAAKLPAGYVTIDEIRIDFR
ncbi:MAG: hypothetical protein NTW19_08345 [Planctomycetota bacterium]|nr:hypothetical protein [Planctomycetota bacterium]